MLNPVDVVLRSPARSEPAAAVDRTSLDHSTKMRVTLTPEICPGALAQYDPNFSSSPLIMLFHARTVLTNANHANNERMIMFWGKSGCRPPSGNLAPCFSA